jgi:hypothetical protein
VESWIETQSGGRFDLPVPLAEQVNIEDIAHSLSLKTRFNGQSTCFYSVAQHSVLCAQFLWGQYKDFDLAFAGLMHDASEAYIPDVPRPLKPLLTNFKEIEDGILEVICRKFGVQWPLPKEYKEADDVLLATEALAFMAPGVLKRWNLPCEPLATEIQPWNSDFAKRLFNCSFQSLKYLVDLSAKGEVRLDPEKHVETEIFLLASEELKLK